MSFEYKDKVYKLVEQPKEDKDAALAGADNYHLCAGCAFRFDGSGCSTAPSCSANDGYDTTYVFKEVKQDV